MSQKHPMTVTGIPVLVDEKMRLKDIISPTQCDQINKKAKLKPDENMFCILLQKRYFTIA